MAAVNDWFAGTMRRVNGSTEILVGAAIGIGIASQAACRGGADMLLALNAGRFRTMGAPSIASILCLRNNNDFVMDFACAEILPRASVPVFFGACAFDPRAPLADIVAGVAHAGFHGIVNFPTVAWLDGRLRCWLDHQGYGFQREIEMMSLGRRAGLLTLAYVRTHDEAVAMATAGVQILNLNFGWNEGGAKGVKSTFALEDTIARAQSIFRAVRQIQPDVICMLEGGPILNPGQMFEVCQAANAHGYIGGSTIDRLPLEQSIEHVTAAFKSVGLMQRKIDNLEAQLKRFGVQYGLIGHSKPMVRIQKMITRFARADVPVLITGEAGAGKMTVATALHGAGPSAHRTLRSFTPVGLGAEDQMRGLFGLCRDASGLAKTQLGWIDMAAGSTLVIKEVAELCPAAQVALLDALERRSFRRTGGDEWLPLSVRLVATSRLSLEALKARLDPGLLTRLGATCISVPPLRDRREDIPLLISHFLEELRLRSKFSSAGLDPSAWRQLLTYDWPGNVRELRAALESAATIDGAKDISKFDFNLPAKPKNSNSKRKTPHEEREWILHVLRRHRFRRGETARDLGISRKTLYTKMKKYDLP